METFDTVRREDQVKVKIFGPDGSLLYEGEGSGYHTIENAIEETLSRASISISPEDCVFEVSNETTGVVHKYRFNAHGHLKLII